nr:YcnI family protein [Spirilliplanes yamanashiensis]
MLLAAAGATVLAVLATGAPALAHVTVSAPAAVQGGYTRAAVSVPNESDTASTVKVELFMPEQTPVASVRTTPIAGWTATVEKGKPAVPLESHGTPVTEVVTKITWTAAAGGGVKPGEFAEFPLSMGPLPAAPRLVFKALQTYSDGNVSRWIEEPPAAGGEEPESPAPVLALAAAPADGAAPAATGTSVEAAADDDDDAEESESGPALGLGIAGLVAGLAGLALGALAFARTRKQNA